MSFELSDSFGIPDVKEFVSDQDFNPLAPARGSEAQNPSDPEPRDFGKPGSLQEARVRDWRKEIKTKRSSGPFGPLQRILLVVGGIFALGSVAVNLMDLLGVNLFGSELEENNIGSFIGLTIGLVGAGLIAASLIKFPAASRIAGAGTAIFVFAVFIGSLGNTQQNGDPTPPLAENSTSENKLAQFKSPWFEKYPNWLGFKGLQRMPSPADRWNRHQLGGYDFSATFLGDPKPGKKRLRVARKNVDMDTLSVSENGFDFSLSAFKYPETNKEAKEMLNATELALGDIEYGKSIEKDGFSGRQYRITDSSVSTHGQIFVVEPYVVHIKVNGSSTMVPGVLSQDFLGSLLTRPVDFSEKKTPPFELSEKDTERQPVIGQNLRDLGVLVSEHIRTGGLLNFPAAYLSISAGKDVGTRRFLFHPGKLPIVGVDLITASSKEGAIVTDIAPIYDKPTDENSIMAKDGYALAGLEVNAGAWVKGVRLIFMKVIPTGFDTSKSYRTEWFGSRPSGVAEKLGGDGRPVYGFWGCRTDICKSIGLIRENN
ncbi:MAG: hypothetical protein P8M80_11535 [Pirellulaceae bacterium]|nr:hypothetical protein [Pirellulaceae bacterium]